MKRDEGRVKMSFVLKNIFFNFQKPPLREICRSITYVRREHNARTKGKDIDRGRIRTLRRKDAGKWDDRYGHCAVQASI